MKLFNSKNSVASVSEKDLISRARKILGASGLPSPYGSGDDCALIRRDTLSENIFFTVDSVIAGRHFTYDTPASAAAAKLVKRNVSDVASMGARPLSAVVACIYSKNLSIEWFEEFCVGLRNASIKYGLKIIGGDMASVDVDFFSAELTLLGMSDGRVLTRRGAEAGDSVFVTGKLGLSFETGKHLNFEPRIEEGLWFASRNEVVACTDISDGLASDSKNMLPEGVCLAVSESDIPRAEADGRTASVDEALCGGEDYELCVCLRGDTKSFEEAYFQKFGRKIYFLGKMEKANSGEENALVICDSSIRRPYDRTGWSH